jgi:hypothetical protein
MAHDNKAPRPTDGRPPSAAERFARAAEVARSAGAKAERAAGKVERPIAEGKERSTNRGGLRNAR